MSRLYYFISGLVVIIIVYMLASAIYISSSTGLLLISPSDKNATISVDQSGHRIANLGSGSQRIRLVPGSYDVIASSGKNQIIKTISVQKKQTYNLTPSPQQNQNPKAIYNSQANNLINKYLPFTERHSAYRVSYLYQPSSSINQPVIVITAPDAGGQQAALKWIGSLGYDTSHFVIKFETASL